MVINIRVGNFWGSRRSKLFSQLYKDIFAFPPSCLKCRVVFAKDYIAYNSFIAVIANQMCDSHSCAVNISP